MSLAFLSVTCHQKHNRYIYNINSITNFNTIANEVIFALDLNRIFKLYAAKFNLVHGLHCSKILLCTTAMCYKKRLEHYFKKRSVLKKYRFSNGNVNNY